MWCAIDAVERNANLQELVSKLRALGKLRLLFTVDGKEYLTPDQLERESQEQVHGVGLSHAFHITHNIQGG